MFPDEVTPKSCKIPLSFIPTIIPPPSPPILSTIFPALPNFIAMEHTEIRPFKNNVEIRNVLSDVGLKIDVLQLDDTNCCIMKSVGYVSIIEQISSLLLLDFISVILRPQQEPMDCHFYCRYDFQYNSNHLHALRLFRVDLYLGKVLDINIYFQMQCNISMDLKV